MRLTIYADYSLRLLIYLALRPERSATVPEIADAYGISRNHLVKVTHQLGLEGFLVTTRGRHGGLRLARPASQITAGEIIRRMEPDFALVSCFPPTDADCAILPGCILRKALSEARDAFLTTLDGYTLQDLAGPRIKLQQLLGIRPPARPTHISARA